LRAGLRHGRRIQRKDESEYLAFLVTLLAAVPPNCDC
jgi:hypothetical protein